MAINALDVFVNCPFDDDYKPIFYAIVWTIIRSGYRVRCALETDNAADNRLNKICGIIAECQFGIHDISRTESDGDPALPRFNMPLELGLFLGARSFGDKEQRGKACIIFDRDRFRYQRFISDIAGHDIHAHGGNVSILIGELAAWMRTQPGGLHAGGGHALEEEYLSFIALLPDICGRRRMRVDEITFSDFNEIATSYIAALL